MSDEVVKKILQALRSICLAVERREHAGIVDARKTIAEIEMMMETKRLGDLLDGED